MTTPFVMSAVLAALLTFVAVPEVARRWGVVDVPNKRSSHALPTPRGGGLAIAAVVLVVFPLAALDGSHEAVTVLTYLSAGAAVAGLGWLDDRRSLSPYLRLAVQTIAAALIIVGIGFFGNIDLPFVGHLRLGWFGVPLTLIWLVGLCNAYNFMDGIDGLAAGQSGLTGLLWAILGLLYGLPLVAGLGMLLAASSLGFLAHNWSPARIFMGDVGSAFLGFSFAVLPIMATVETGNDRFALAGGLLVGVFVFDTVATFVRRLWRHENVFRAHRSHLYQRLVATGYSHNTVAEVFLALGVVAGALGVVFVTVPEPLASIAAMCALVVMLGLIVGVVRRERAHLLVALAQGQNES